MARTVSDWIDRWQDAGLVDGATADRLRDDTRTAADEPSEPAGSAVDRFIGAARGGVLEALGYLGAALTVGALVVLLDIPRWNDVALVGLLVVVAGTAALGLFLLTPPQGAAMGRLAGVLGATSVAATASTLMNLLSTDCFRNCTLWQEYGWRAVVAGGAATVAAVLYARHRHVLTHVALGAATIATMLSLGPVIAGAGADWQAREAWSGGLLFVATIAWVVLSERGTFVPAWLGTLVAGGVSYLALVTATNSWGFFGSGNDRDAALLTLVLAVSYTLTGALMSRLRPTIVGVGGLLIAVPWTFTEVLGWTATQTAGLLLPVGIILTVWAVMSSRDRPARDGLRS